MLLKEELTNRRNCRSGLHYCSKSGGVIVKVPSGEESEILGSYWGKGKVLMLKTHFGEFSADQLELLSVWPAYCCTPKKRHSLNYGSSLVRKEVFKRDGYKCLRCGSTEKLNVDHIYPKSKGGTDKISNLQTLCWPCNRVKGAKIETE